jgi:hypothetical protein
MLLAGVAAVTVASACSPPPTVPGNPADFAVNVFTIKGQTGSWLQRWNPCAPVHYRVNDALNPSALASVKTAVASLSKATGITFVFDGTTTYVPNQNQWNQPASLVISFAKHTGQAGGSNLLAGGNQLGEGGFESQYSTVNGKVTSYKIVKGYAVIDSAAYNAATVNVRTHTLLHELGHAVGLNHAHFTGEIMYPSISNGGPGAYSSGDLAGLAKVGRPSGCLS